MSSMRSGGTVIDCRRRETPHARGRPGWFTHHGGRTAARPARPRCMCNGMDKPWFTILRSIWISYALQPSAPIARRLRFKRNERTNRIKDSAHSCFTVWLRRHGARGSRKFASRVPTPDAAPFQRGASAAKRFRFGRRWVSFLRRVPNHNTIVCALFWSQVRVRGQPQGTHSAQDRMYYMSYDIPVR